MTNQKAYEELCDKAEKYDKLVKAIKDIKADLLKTFWCDDDAYIKTNDIIDKHAKELL